MRIQHNIMAMNANRNLTFNNTQMSKNLEKLSSGYRVNRAGDDAAGLAISESMRRSIASYKQGINNANDGISLIQTAEGALTEVHSMLNRAQTLVTQKGNETLTSTDKAKIKDELTQLSSEISRILGKTEFNGKSLLSASLSVKIDLGDAGSITIKNSTALKTTITLSSATTADNIKSYINKVSTVRSTLGAYQNRLEHTVNNMGVTMENLQSAESTIRDVNIADEMMAYTKNNILIQSAQAMLAQANQVPQGVLQLMQ